MKNRNKILTGLLTVSLLVFSGCSTGGDSSSSDVVSSLSGIAQKGPYAKDSNVTLCKLDEKLACTADKLETKVSDDDGSYAFSSLPWSGLSRLTISGYYLDEVTGNRSLSPATISAIVNIQPNEKQKRNTNILTDLHAKRMKKLVDDDKSIEEAGSKAKEDIKKLFNITSDDFTELDLLDFSAGKASVNAELLRISAAIAKSNNPLGDLEELIKIYDEGGLAAVLASSLYNKLMADVDKVDVREILTTLGESEDTVNAIGATQIVLSPFARASMRSNGVLNSSSQVEITLFGTEFNSADPSIGLNIEGGSISITSKSVSDDNRSVILDMNTTSSCKDMNITFTLDYMTLEDVDAMPLQTNVLRYNDPMTICVSADDDGTTKITVPANKLPIAIIGMDYIEVDQAEQSREVYVGEIVSGMESSYSHDRDPYPYGGIRYCKWEDENSVVVKSSDDASCDLYDLVFDTVGNYDYTLTVTDTAGATDSNVVHITVLANTPPSVSITPSSITPINVGETLTLNAVVNDADSGDTTTQQWKYNKIGSTTSYGAGSALEFSHIFNEVGDYNISVLVRDTKNAQAQTSVVVSVVSPNHAPTVAISPAGDKNINVGENVTLTALATDEDGDNISYTWMMKNVDDTLYRIVPTNGANSFLSHFSEVGSYMVRVLVEDTHGAKADASVTINVVEVPPAVVNLDDINISVVVKVQKNFSTGLGTSQDDVVVHEGAQHGDVEVFLVGNEIWNITYTSTDCFVGADSFVYKRGNDYGRVNVTITSPSVLSVTSESQSIFNTETISGKFLRAHSSSINIEITTATSGGSSSLTIVGNEIVNYNYDPDDSFVGDDFFIYKLSEVINSCSYTKEGQVDIEVKAALSNVHLFNWYDSVHGYEIWRTDGTVEGTAMVKDIWPGTNNSGAVSGTVIDGIHYFGANDGNHSVELWRSDGTESGTYMVKDINSGIDDGSFPYELSIIDKNFYFFARTGDNNGSNWIGNQGLWKSDGTEAGTQLVEEFGDDSLTSYMGAGYLKAFGDLLIFAKDDGPGGGPQWEPWISDGSSSAFKLKDIRPGDDGSGFINCVELNSKCYASADDYTHGSELWVTDGTEAGTEMVKDIYVDDGTGRGIGHISNLTVVGSQLFFVSKSLDNGYALYKSNGTSAGTVMVKDSFDGIGESYNYSHFTDVNGVLYFVFNDVVNGQELWKSDGTAAGTVMVKDMGSDEFSAPSALINLNGTLYFWFNDYANPDSSGLYKTDGTSAGTSLVKAFSSASDTGYEVSGSGIKSEDSKLYIELMNYGNSYTKEYWISDGTEAGTFKLVDGESMGGEN